jgi:hypothetical protein
MCCVDQIKKKNIHYLNFTRNDFQKMIKQKSEMLGFADVDKIQKKGGGSGWRCLKLRDKENDCNNLDASNDSDEFNI